MLIYLASINVFSVLLFIYDKLAAMYKRSRIPERTLHLLELLGAALGIFCMMYLINHKRNKAAYFLVNWTISLAWLALIYFMFAYNFIKK